MASRSNNDIVNDVEKWTVSFTDGDMCLRRKTIDIFLRFSHSSIHPLYRQFYLDTSNLDQVLRDEQASASARDRNRWEMCASDMKSRLEYLVEMNTYVIGIPHPSLEHRIVAHWAQMMLNIHQRPHVMYRQQMAADRAVVWTSSMTLAWLREGYEFAEAAREYGEDRAWEMRAGPADRTLRRLEAEARAMREAEEDRARRDHEDHDDAWAD